MMLPKQFLSLQMWPDFACMTGDPASDPAKIRQAAAERLRCILSKYQTLTNSEGTGKPKSAPVCVQSGVRVYSTLMFVKLGCLQ